MVAECGEPLHFITVLYIYENKVKLLSLIHISFNLRIKDANEEQQEETQINFGEVFDEFVKECGNQNNWTPASRLTIPRGKFFMIHRPIRLVDILTLGRKYNMEPKQIQFIHPRAGKAPNLVLVEFMKDGKPELKILDPLYVYGEDGNYTEELKAIYANEDIGEK